MFGHGIRGGEIERRALVIMKTGLKDVRNGERSMTKKKKINKPKKYYTVTMTFDQWVDINQELQSKAMFLGGVTKLSRSERVLLIFTNDIMFGSDDARKETKH
jgi:hypothetical protein